MDQSVDGDFALIVPVHEAPTDLARLGDSLRRLTWPRDRVQILVAVDGPHAATEAVAAQFADEVVVLPTNQGSYAARNAAIDRLRPSVRWVAFTDSDCIVSPGFLEAHLELLQATDMSGGDVRVTLRAKPAPAELVDKERHLRQEQYVTIDGYAATANLAVRREIAEELRFRSELRSGGDADFCLRARSAGYQLQFNRDAWVEHPARQTHREVMKKIRRICTGIEANPERWADREHPPPRRTLYMARIAHRQDLSQSPIWWLRAVLLDWRASKLVHRSAVLSRTEGLRRRASAGSAR